MGGYSPGNCRWATWTQQNRNRSNNRLLSLDDQTATLTEWAEKIGIPFRTLWNRLDRGWSVERALTEPKKVANE